MAECDNCGDEYSDKRAALQDKEGEPHLCLNCGAKSAYIQAKNKAKRVAPPYSKGAYQYITDTKDFSSLGRKV